MRHSCLQLQRRNMKLFVVVGCVFVGAMAQVGMGEAGIDCATVKCMSCEWGIIRSTPPGRCCPICAQKNDQWKCPDDPFAIGICVELCPSNVKCPKNYICCSNGCGHLCMKPIKSDSCAYDGTIYKNGDSFPANDGCNTCTCMNGFPACTLRPCPL